MINNNSSAPLPSPLIRFVCISPVSRPMRATAAAKRVTAIHVFSNVAPLLAVDRWHFSAIGVLLPLRRPLRSGFNCSFSCFRWHSVISRPAKRKGARVHRVLRHKVQRHRQRRQPAPIRVRLASASCDNLLAEPSNRRRSLALRLSWIRFRVGAIARRLLVDRVPVPRTRAPLACAAPF